MPEHIQSDAGALLPIRPLQNCRYLLEKRSIVVSGATILARRERGARTVKRRQHLSGKEVEIAGTLHHLGVQQAALRVVPAEMPRQPRQRLRLWLLDLTRKEVVKTPCGDASLRRRRANRLVVQQGPNKVCEVHRGVHTRESTGYTDCNQHARQMLIQNHHFCHPFSFIRMNRCNGEAGDTHLIPSATLSTTPLPRPCAVQVLQAVHAIPDACSLLAVLHPSHRALWVSLILDNAHRARTFHFDHDMIQNNVIKCNHFRARRPSFTLNSARHSPLFPARRSTNAPHKWLQNAPLVSKKHHPRSHVTILPEPLPSTVHRPPSSITQIHLPVLFIQVNENSLERLHHVQRDFLYPTQQTLL